MTAPDRIRQLVETFGQNREAYKKGAYNETQVRREFIDPFFEELGWDVTNQKGYAEAYKDVIHEDAIKVGGLTKAPDYCFRIGGARKFFLEAKKPAVNIKEDTHPAYQLRRYGWSAKLPLSILTDFEEFAVYDCRVKPAKTDKVAHSRILYLTCTDYIHRWEEIAGIFSREAVLKGSFDRYVVSNKARKGTTPVDTAFLQEIERWRELLARNLSLRNPDLSQRELNFAVQRTIDRIVFLRICEDRGMEEYGRLLALRSGENCYPRLFQLFRQADEKYNSGLFHFKPEKGRENCDRFTPALTIDDKVLKEIFKNLYYPDSPYEFSVLSTDILGQVYERFLGKVIRLTSGHQARIEEKPEVRKAGGVYYTPTYIVDYIVRQTVGRLVSGKKPGPRGGVCKLKILDPACGSGSFLIGAYQYLLDWHRDRYLADNPEKWARGKTPALYQARGGEWRLTTEERKRILINNIYGVDIDPQAVEVTKLSLLLKVLEGEDEQSLGKQLMLFQERVLPDLADNIKCGNSLIGPDFYQQQQMHLLEEEELFRVNAFDWQTEFAQIMTDGGFDAVIGNPPYVRQEGLGDSKEYFKKQYAVYNGVADLYVYFIERGISLLKEGGRFSYIVANKWLRANYGKALRQWLKQQHIAQIVDFGDLPVFTQATTYPCILVVQNKTPNATFAAATLHTLDFPNLADHVQTHQYEVRQKALNDTGWSLVDQNTQDLLDKIHQAGIPLGEYVEKKIYRGVLTGLNEAFVIDDATYQRLAAEDARSTEIIKPFLAGRDIKRYQPLFPQNHLILFPRGFTSARCPHGSPWEWLKQEYPAIAAHLEPFKEKAEKRYDKGEYWWELRACEYYAEFEKPKIIVPAIVRSASYAFDTESFYSNDKTTIIPTSDKYMLGLLNSKLLDFFIHSIASTKQGGYFEYKPMYISKISIRTIDFSNPADQADHDRLVTLVEQMLALNQKLVRANTDQEKAVLQRQIETTDHRIDQLVYKLYDLTEKEIQIVEGYR